METNYQKMYATLAGRVDNTLTQLEENLKKEQLDRIQMQNVADMLKDALLEAEENFIEEK